MRLQCQQGIRGSGEEKTQRSPGATRLEDETTARSKGTALVTGPLALFAFSCAAALSLVVMLAVASWADIGWTGKSLAPKSDEGK
jgi:hypothetical protein